MASGLSVAKGVLYIVGGVDVYVEASPIIIFANSHDRSYNDVQAF